MKSLDVHIRNYHAYHETRLTKVTHAFAIPMLVFAILIFFSWIRIDFATHIQIDVAWIIVFGIVIYYLCLHVGIGILMAIILGLLSWLADWIAGPKPDFINATIFLLLLIPSILLIHFGHVHEKRHASTPKNFYHFSIALLMLVVDLLGFIGIRRFKP